MPKLAPISENVIRVPESIDTNAADKPLGRGSKIKHDRDTAAGEDDISSWVDELDERAQQVAFLENLTQDLRSTAASFDWVEADASDADLIIVNLPGDTVGVPTGVTLTDSLFDGDGPDIMTTQQAERQWIATYARVAADTDVEQWRVYFEGVGVTGGGAWTKVAGPDETTYDYYHIENAGLGTGPAARVHIQKHPGGAHKTTFGGGFSGLAKAVTDETRRIAVGNKGDVAELVHLTRDLHSIEIQGTWEDAADSDADLYVALTSVNPNTLTDSDFDNGGASVTVPTNADTGVYARLPIAVDHTLYRVVFGDSFGRSKEGNRWVSMDISAASTTYQYWWADGFTNFAHGVVKLQKRDAASASTRYDGDGAIPAGGTSGQVLAKLSADDYDTGWVDEDLSVVVHTGDLADKAVTRAKLSDTLQQEISDAQNTAIAWRDLLHLTGDTSTSTSTGGVSDALTFTVEDLVPKRPYEFVLNVTLDVTDEDSQDRTNNLAPYLVIGDTEYPLVDDDDRKDINGYSAREATFVTKQPVVFWPETDTQEATLRFKAEHDFFYALDGGSVLLLGQGISATSTQQALFDFDDLPDPNLHEPGNVIIANDKFYKLGVTAAGDGTKASDYKGTVGDLYRSNAFGGEKWTGISSIYGPAEVSTEGEWTANYDNAIALIAADDERFIQVAIKRSVYRHFRGSSFREQSGTLFMRLVLESGARDEMTLAYFDYYDAVDEHRYLVFQHQNVELNAPDYNLYDEPLGNSFTATFYAGDDTTATLITHPADAKHWIVFAPTPPVARDTRLRDLPKLPNADDYNSGDLVPVDDLFYKLATTDATRANLFSGDVGRDTIHTTSAELWRGLSNSQSPGGFSTGGEWTANPNNAISFLIASSSRRLRVATKKSVYEAAKGSEFNTDDHIAIKVTMADGTTADEAVLEYYNQYLADTDYIIWEHRHATDNYNLYSEASGNGVTIEFFTTTGDPPAATTTPLLTHAADMKHWLLWAAIGGARNALALAQANQARLDALDIQVGEAEPVSVATYDDSNTTLVVVYNHDTVNASKTIANVESTDLVVIDWTDFETYPDWEAYLVPGSTPARGRLHIQASEIGNRYFGYGTNILRIEGTTTPSPKSSLPFLHLSRATNSINVDFYHSNVGATGSGRYVPAPGFSLKFSIYRNADALEGVGSRIAALDSPEGRRPRKGDGIATLPFHFRYGFNNQSWNSLNTARVEAGADATGSLSQELKVDIRHYAQNSLGFIAEMWFTDLGDRIVACRMFVPWSAIPIDGTEVMLAVAYHQIEPSQEATTEVIAMKAVMSFSDGENRPLSFIVPGGDKPRGLTGDVQGRTGEIRLYEAV